MTKIACNIYVRNEKNEILAVSRKDDTTKFGLPGGKWDEGEDYKTTAIRELKEETGLDIKNVSLIYTGDDDFDYINYTYTGTISGEINTTEAGVVAWVDEQVLLDGPFGFYNKKLFDHIQNEDTQKNISKQY